MTDTNPYFTSNYGLLYWCNKLVILATSLLIQKVHLEIEIHSSPVGGHSGVTRSMAQISSQFQWPRRRLDIKLFILHCVVCQQAKTPTGLLHGFTIPSPFQLKYERTS